MSLATDEDINGILAESDHDGRKRTIHTNDTEYMAWQKWHIQREKSMASPYGWLSQTGLYWLNSLNNYTVSVPKIPGIWWQKADTVWFSPCRTDNNQKESKEPYWLVSGECRTPITDIISVASDLTQTPPYIEYDGVRAFVIKRDGTLAIRVRDPRSPFRLRFSGIPTFEFNPSWVVNAKFIPFASAKNTTVETHAAGLNSTIPAVGEITLCLSNRPLRLLAFDGENNLNNRELFLIFKDATNGSTTYASGRFLSVPLPSQFQNENDGTSIPLDFNRAVNPPCALSPYCTCPLAPEQNVIPLPVVAGEQIDSVSSFAE